MIMFAFYGQVSTEDQQDPESSRGWQLTPFFDVDKSRSIPRQRRPMATALLAEDRADKAEIYSQLGLALTYHPNEKRAVAEARPTQVMYVGFLVRGDCTQKPMVPRL